MRVSEWPSWRAHRHRAHGQDRGMGVPQDVETDGGRDASPGAGLAHRAQLLGPFPGPPVVATQQKVAGRAAHR